MCPQAAAAVAVYTLLRLRPRKFDYIVPSRDEELLGGLRELVDAGDDADNDANDDVGEDGFFGNMFDEQLPEEYEDLGVRLRMPARRARWVVKAATMAKVKFGVLQQTEANELMVSDYVRKLMVEHGVRPSHIVQLYPLAVALALMPSQSEVMYSKLRGSGQNTIAKLLESGPWEPHDRCGVGRFGSRPPQINK